MINVEVELVQEPTFTVKANGKEVSGMRLVSEWEGLRKLQDSRGRVAIVANKDGPYLSAMKLAFGATVTTCLVVMCSPDLADELGLVK